MHRDPVLQSMTKREQVAGSASIFNEQLNQRIKESSKIKVKIHQAQTIKQS